MIRTYKRTYLKGVVHTTYEYLELELIGPSSARILGVKHSTEDEPVAQTFSLILDENSFVTHVKTYRPLYPGHRGRINKVINQAKYWSYFDASPPTYLTERE